MTDGKGGSGQGSGTVEVRPDPVNPWFLRNRRVYFEFDRYELDDDDRELLGKITVHLKQHGNLKLTIEGHTCYIATEEYNLALGDNRAKAILDYLVEQGLSTDQFSPYS